MTREQAKHIIEKRYGMEVVYLAYMVPEDGGYRVAVELEDGSAGDEMVYPHELEHL
jgi:hypothetical protein